MEEFEDLDAQSNISLSEESHSFGYGNGPSNTSKCYDYPSTVGTFEDLTFVHCIFPAIPLQYDSLYPLKTILSTFIARRLYYCLQLTACAKFLITHEQHIARQGSP